MKTIVTTLGLCLTLVAAALTGWVFAADQSTVCLELADKAEDFIHEKGKEYALKVFSASKGPFIDKEMYVFACSMDGKLLAHPYRRDIVGQDVNNLTDSKGKPIFREFQKVAQQKGTGWVSYWWTKPGEQREFSKTTYIKRIPDYNIYIGVGYYKPVQYSQNANRPDAN
ncbi:MAG: cache domain-containing protein [Desulfomonile tiedjei]|uniref:Cache domain-containing protein n=1 Tax=Desulfomonile tiedjei TaxID=2358 RepID=A0A9D6V1E3_9BACT|nr:cache domain-containing protein [Desulfomonile tiedjei]